MYDNPWLFDGQPFDTPDINGYYGFVYIITSLIDGSKYIGRKYFWQNRRKTKKATRRTKSESNWKLYYGSSDILKKEIENHGSENFRRDIISLHSTKGRVNYEEVREQFLHGVLEEDGYINENINGKWRRSPDHIREKSRFSTRASRGSPE